MSANFDLWHRAPRGNMHAILLEHVQRLEQEQSDVFDRFVKLEALYDPNGAEAGDSGEQLAHVQENVIASNVDTVAAVVATSDVRARFMTDGADWGQQRQARHLEWYAEEIAKLTKILPKCRAAFKECAKKGNGVVKVTAELDELQVEHVLVENIVVAANECRDGRTPREMHEWAYVDVDDLIARFPKFETEIEAARTSGSQRRSRRFGQVDTDVEVLHSFRLPTGKKGKPGYKAGRETVVINGTTLRDRKYEKPHFPYAAIVWSDRLSSWYGISGAERIAGIQRALNRRNWQIERQLDQGALPTTYVRPVDANLAAKSNRVGAVVVIKGDYPETRYPTAVSGETYQSRNDLRASANDEFGLTRMATHGAKPAGLDSAVALREFQDQTTQRFAPQEKSFEGLVLEVTWLSIDKCKDLGKNAPTIQRKTRFGKKVIPWAKVDMKDVKVQIAAASNLGRTPSGRIQFVIELAQAGVISTDATRRLLKHPDLERELSLFTAALENVEHCLDEIADGKRVMPEPFMNLEMVVWRGQLEYLIWRDDGAPEKILEALRQFVVQAAWMVSKKQAAANQNAPALDPMAPPAPMGADPMLPGAPPPGATPAAAMASQAMDLRAG